MSCSIRGRRPRVLVVNKLYPPVVGGVEKVAQDIVDELADLIDFHVLVCQTKGRRSIERQGNVTIERCASWGVARSMPLSVDFLRRYRQLAPEFDLVHFHEPFPLGALAGVSFGFRRGVVTFHCEVGRQKILKHLYLPVLDRLLKRSDVIMPTSPRLAKYAKALQPHSERIRSVLLGIDDSILSASALQEDEICAIRKRLGAKFVFLAVGRCVGFKGFEVLIDAFAQLDQGHLVIVGDGPLRRSLEQQASGRGLVDRIHFAGELVGEELAPYFHACDVFVLPSVFKAETFGLVQLEAMACGKPVINTDLPTGVPYVSPHGETGITVPAGQVDPLADAMRQLYDNSQMREAFGQNAKRRFLENFQRSQMAENVLAVYREVLGGELGQLPRIEGRRELAA
jgi:glycosyltransferase involved in cell wall biosynthesis